LPGSAFAVRLPRSKRRPPRDGRALGPSGSEPRSSCSARGPSVSTPAADRATARGSASRSSGTGRATGSRLGNRPRLRPLGADGRQLEPRGRVRPRPSRPARPAASRADQRLSAALRSRRAHDQARTVGHGYDVLAVGSRVLLPEQGDRPRLLDL
jgi:hypothetical protein